MKIVVPSQLTPIELRKLLVRSYSPSFLRNNRTCQFDWTTNEFIGLPEAVILLSWSSKLIAEGHSVEWLMFNSVQSSSGLEEVRAQASHEIGSDPFLHLSNTLNKLVNTVRRGEITSEDYKLAVNALRARIREVGADAMAGAWLDLELRPFKRLGVLTYMHRYRFITRASEAGINISPNPSEIPHFKIRPAPDTACLELRSIRSSVDVGSLVQELNQPYELQRVLGDYAGLDVARGGALANILITELGNNIEEHALASSAWLWTRLVLARNVETQTAEDRVVGSFRENQRGFLELCIADNGVGLVSELDSVLTGDQRDSAKSKYSSRNQPREVQLVDYAFDRLSSRRRDIAALVHLETDIQSPAEKHFQVVSSGLYWVWNVVRSHRGILSIYTAGYCVWYDFSDNTGYGNPREWKLVYPSFEPLGENFCGTLIRICLPLPYDDEISSKFRPVLFQPSDPRPVIRNKNFSFVWVGDLARNVPVKRPTKRSRKSSPNDSDRLPGLGEGHEMRLLQELQKRHFPLRDGDVLVLDLSGVRSRWAKHSAVPLCQFVLEMNYTSTIGRSAVVLWNVPTSSEEVFELALKLGDLFERQLENANRKHTHLRDLRRAAMLIFDNDSVRIFCGWPEAELILSRLRSEAEADLDEIGYGTLDKTDQLRLVRLITENSHLFEWTGENRVRLRIWPAALRIAAWAEGILWFDSLLNTSVQDGGVHLIPDRGYFRLPSTGFLVKEFYQFRGLLASHEACSKLAWHVAQIVNSIAMVRDNDTAPLRLISVSRSIMTLAHHLGENYYYDRNGHINDVIADKTIEEIEAGGGDPSITGCAILLTDVISSGRLCERIAQAFPKIRWLGTVVLLETRYDVTERLTTLRNGIETFEIDATVTGPTFALAVRKIEKFNPAELGPVETTAIDEVNVCAVQSSERLPDTVQNFWTFAERKPESIRIGHYTGNNHHYVYKVDVGELLAAKKLDGESLLEFIVKYVSSDLERKHYDPDATVIMHPPHDHSYAERIAKAVRLNTGVLFRHILYKDNFAGHWRFSPFVQHGVPLKNSTLVLIDDGTNTAETLMGLLDAATFGSPKHVLAYVGITRMPPHKNHLFTSLKSLHGLHTNGTIKVEFILGLSIPVYSPRECPICRLVEGLSHVADNSPLLRRYAVELMKNLRPSPPPALETQAPDFLWIYAPESKLSVTKLREALETLDYNSPSAELVNSVLNDAIISGDKRSLLNLAFAVCAEPDLVNATVFAPYLDSQEQELIRRALQSLVECAQSELLTFVGFAFHLIVRSYQRSPNVSPFPALNSFWSALLARPEISTPIVGRIISYILGEASRELRPEFNSSKVRISRHLLFELAREVNPRTNAKPRIDGLAITRAFAYLFVREALTPQSKAQLSTDPRARETVTDFYDLATQAASSFWRHASEHTEAHIDLISEALAIESPSTADRLYGPIHSLIVSFDQLYELRERIREVERMARQETNEALGMPNWDGAELNSAIARFMQALVGIAEEAEGTYHLDRKSINETIRALQRAWEHLKVFLSYAFEEMFPEVQGIVANKWGKFAEEFDFPPSVAEPLRIDRALSRDLRAFIPRNLLTRFLNASLQNLRSAAFSGWSREDIVSYAKARVEITPAGLQAVSVKIIDNGPLRKQEKQIGHRVGLKNVRLMANHFGAELVGPESNNGTTFVELRIRTRETGKV